ncbi:hypothetical protein BJX64DRAFT_286043 [Aspergillus heterothallicus]
MTAPRSLPSVPVKHSELVEYLRSHPNEPIQDLRQPYNDYDMVLRQIFAKEPDHPAIADGLLNIVPLYDVDGDGKVDLRIRARSLATESDDVKEKYIMPLADQDRRPNGSPAVVSSFEEFQTHFSIFSEGSLASLNWDNVLAVCSSVATALLPLPAEFAQADSKRKIPHFYHVKFALASDVDLFLYGLDHDQAIEKIKRIERCISDSALNKTTAVRTKHAITIVPQCPTRPVQIFRRLYRSPAEILTGLDIDCSAVAYNRRQTTFERNMQRTVGLARLLMLEKLPRLSEREAYRNKRRRERGRPEIEGSLQDTLRGNIKVDWDDEIPDLMETDRTVNLHRHPAFFGTVDEVLRGCCGSCPVPATDEETPIAKKESKTFIPGEIAFLADGPSRQEIISFHPIPITEGDWTEMVYLANEDALCQAIVNQDIDAVRLWVAKRVDVNRRDHTGRTPLHLAVMASTPGIVQCLIDNDARISWRLADGRTALHLAAARGNVSMILNLMIKSEQNETEAKMLMRQRELKNMELVTQSSIEQYKDLNRTRLDVDSTDHVSHSTGSFIKVPSGETSEEDLSAAGDSLLSPDILAVDAVDWDLGASPLHLAILNGHLDAVDELVNMFGADVLLPVKPPNKSARSQNLATLPLVQALALPLEQAKKMTAKLLELDASPAQVDSDNRTPLTYLAAAGHHEILDLYLHYDQPGVAQALNHFAVVAARSTSPVIESPLTVATWARNATMASRLLDLGAHPAISVPEIISSAQRYPWIRSRSTSENQVYFQERLNQPVIAAVKNDQPFLALELLGRNVGPNTLTPEGYTALRESDRTGQSLLDQVRERLNALRGYKGESIGSAPLDRLDPEDNVYLSGFKPGTYQRWGAEGILAEERDEVESQQEEYRNAVESAGTREGLEEEKAAIRELVQAFEKLEANLVERGAKTFRELHPDR